MLSRYYHKCITFMHVPLDMVILSIRENSWSFSYCLCKLLLFWLLLLFDKSLDINSNIYKQREININCVHDGRGSQFLRDVSTKLCITVNLQLIAHTRKDNF